jgi:hypothetical protein
MAALPPEIEARIAAIGEDELRFRGWTREGMRAAFRERFAADARSPQIGDEAPDFALERLSAAGERTGERLRLSSLRGTPVGLIFGSYT